ncbi:MAG: FeoA family protein [Fervidicoccaceae archaeon]|jgi:Fe2+ transport system protein FeoA
MPASKKKLSELKPGERGIIVRIEGDSSFKKRLMDMGVVRGAEVVMVRKAPLGDPIEFLLKGYNLSLRKKECENVYVEVEKGPENDDGNTASNASGKQ